MPTVKIKRLFRVMPWLLAIFLGVVFLILLNRELKLQENVWQQRLAQEAVSQHQLINTTQERVTREAELIANLIAQDSEIIDLIRSAYEQRQVNNTNQINPPSSGAHNANSQDRETTVTLDHIRAQLASKLSDYWSNLQANNGSQLTIYFAPNAEAFYRAHAPKQYGDSLLRVRPMLAAALADGQIKSALDLGRHGAAYRAAIPIYAQAKQQGAIVAVMEIGLRLLDQQLATDNNKAVLINPSVLEWPLGVLAHPDLTNQRKSRRGQWLLEDTNSDMIRAWAAVGVLPNPLQAQGHQLMTWTGQTYLLFSTPLQDYRDSDDQRLEPLVALLSWREITAELAAHQALKRSTTIKWLLVLLLAGTLFLFFLRLSNRHLRTLIREHSQKLAQERDASEAARQQLTLALASGESGFWEWDVLANRVNFSPQWKKLCGLAPDAVTLSDTDEWLTRIHPSDKAVFRRDMLRHLKGETSMFETEYRMRTNDGSYRWVYSRGRVVERLDDTKAAKVLGVYTDITERKQAEVTILRQQAALRSMNEIASLPSIEPIEQLRRALSLGAAHLGLPRGVVGQIEGDIYRVQVQVSAGTIVDGDEFSVADTYCELTLIADDVVVIDHVQASPYTGHPCYKKFQMEAYIAVPLSVSGQRYGTLSFSSTSPRYHPFDELDKDFIRLLGRWTGATLERWQQLEQQEELLKRLRKLGERLPGFLFQFQLCPNGRSFFPYVSGGIDRIFGVRAEQALLNAENVFKQVHPDDRKAVRLSIQESAEQLSIWSVTFRVSHPDGLLWVHGDAKPERLADGCVIWHGVFSNITTEKLVEQELQATNALQQAIFDAASVSIVSTNTEGVIQVFNRGAEKMFGYLASELVGRSTPFIFHLESELVARAAQLSQQLNRSIAPDFSIFRAAIEVNVVDEREWTYVRKDGSQLPATLIISALRNHRGEVVGYLGVARDITELKRIERQKSEFMATISHELRTPLTAINGSLGLVVNGATGEVTEKTQKLLSIAYKNSERLIYLVNDLLDMEKLAAGKMQFNLQWHALQPLVEEAIEQNSAFVNQYGVSCRLMVEGPKVWVNVDAQRLAQVLANYLSNAAKFSSINDVINVHIHAQEHFVRVSVVDQGIGIPSEYHEQIFQKFYQVDSSDSRQKSGTGLGLSICKDIIERMGGQVGFESVDKQGSVFFFDLPAARQLPNTDNNGPS